MHDVSGKCPVCGEGMHITRLKCDYCGSELHGEFKLCKFCQLNDEMKEFVEVFIKSRGNIKEVERELGISYPTVRSRLDKAILALGYQVEETPSKAEMSNARQQVLTELSEGKITANEATKLLKRLG